MRHLFPLLPITAPLLVENRWFDREDFVPVTHFS